MEETIEKAQKARFTLWRTDIERLPKTCDEILVWTRSNYKHICWVSAREVFTFDGRHIPKTEIFAFIPMHKLGKPQ